MREVVHECKCVTSVPILSRSAGGFVYNRACAHIRSDDELITAIQQQRDGAALAELYDRYGARVYSLSLMMLQETTSAQEVTQDAFLKVWTRAQQYSPQSGALVSWLLGIARNAARDRMRHEKIRSAPSIDDENFPEVPDTEALAEARWRDLRLVMNALPKDQRDVIVLSFYRAMSQVDIASYLNVPLGTIKTRMRLGMDKLRAVLRVSEADASTTGSGNV